VTIAQISFSASCEAKEPSLVLSPPPLEPTTDDEEEDDEGGAVRKSMIP